MSEHVGEVKLPVHTRLASSELVQGLSYLEGPLWVGFGVCQAGVKLVLTKQGNEFRRNLQASVKQLEQSYILVS